MTLRQLILSYTADSLSNPIYAVGTVVQSVALYAMASSGVVALVMGVVASIGFEWVLFSRWVRQNHGSDVWELIRDDDDDFTKWNRR